MSERDIMDEVVDRIMILEWMLRHEYRDMEQVGKVMRTFYANPSLVKNAAKQDADPNVVFGRVEGTGVTRV
jgi:hypothetical protein